MIYNVLKNFCLITFALIAPITLPAGGIQKSLNQNKFPNNINEINISESNSLELVNWDIFNSSISKNLEILFNKFVIDKFNEFKYKVNQYKSNMIDIKKVRKAEKLLGNIYSGFILSVQT